MVLVFNVETLEGLTHRQGIYEGYWLWNWGQIRIRLMEKSDPLDNQINGGGEMLNPSANLKLIIEQ